LSKDIYFFLFNNIPNSKYTIKSTKTKEKELKDDEPDKELKEILKPKVIESVASHKEEE
jgi:hypothetical protein